MWEKNKGTTECDKRIVTCDVGTAQCDYEAVKCEKKLEYQRMWQKYGHFFRF